MKYSEFKTEVEKMGYWVDIDHAPIYVDKSEGGETIIAIGKHKRFSVDPGWSGFHSIPEENQIVIYNLAHALTVTPLAEREEEKKYRVKFPSVTRGGRKIYLSKEESCVDPISIDWSEEIYIHDRSGLYTFTEQEIKDIDERYFLFAEEVKK